MQKKLLIVCEGQTEKIYLAAWAAACNVRHRLTILTPSSNGPFGLLREGVKEYLWG